MSHRIMYTEAQLIKRAVALERKAEFCRATSPMAVSPSGVECDADAAMLRAGAEAMEERDRLKAELAHEAVWNLIETWREAANRTSQRAQQAEAERDRLAQQWEALKAKAKNTDYAFKLFDYMAELESQR